MTDPYQAPREAPELDQDPPTVGVIVYLAAIALMITGCVAAASGFQQILFVRWSGLLWIVPVSFGIMGLGQILSAAFLTRGSAIAGIVGFLLSILLGLASIVWLVIALMSGVFSLLLVLWVLTCAPPVLLVPASLPTAFAVTRYKRALRTF
ncbi:MAG: hypothetical protein EA397_17785 [Deltaproteobacteria bacterium]|nr:MAG: hypothetical protein EA397_17785 [Deltaproteobacteria bacterium]